MQHKNMCLCACGFDPVRLLWCVDLLAFSTVKKAPSKVGASMCSTNSLSVSCVSVQSSNTSERVRRPQSDAISEYVYYSVNQNLSRACPPHCFPFFFNSIFPLHGCHHVFFSNGISRSGHHFTFCWGCHWLSRQGSDSNWKDTHWLL